MKINRQPSHHKEIDSKFQTHAMLRTYHQGIDRYAPARALLRPVTRRARLVLRPSRPSRVGWLQRLADSAAHGHGTLPCSATETEG